METIACIQLKRAPTVLLLGPGLRYATKDRSAYAGNEALGPMLHSNSPEGAHKPYPAMASAIPSEHVFLLPWAWVLPRALGGAW